MYSEEYFQARETAVDRSEFIDILIGLRTVGAGRNELIIDVGGDTGELARFLRNHGYNAMACDPFSNTPGVAYCKLPNEVPPASIYVFQHVLEHVSDIEGSIKALSRAWAVVGILPGHFVDDETHVVNHFHHHLDGTIKGLFGEVRVMSIDTVKQLFNKYGFTHVVVTPDTHSYLAPWDNDWLLIASKKPIKAGYVKARQLLTVTRTLIARALARRFSKTPWST